MQVTYPGHTIPHYAARQLLKSLEWHLISSVESFKASADIPVTNLPELSTLNFPPLLSPPPRSRASNCEPDYPNSAYLLHSAFEKQVLQTPHVPALDFISTLSTTDSTAKHDILSYDELDAAATNLAIELLALMPQDKDVTSEQHIVPVYMSTSPELYISYLAVLKAGFAFSPIPVDAPPSRTKEILQDIRSRVILGVGNESSLKEWSAKDVGAIWMNVTQLSKWKSFSHSTESHIFEDAHRKTFKPPKITDDQIAYLLFTSGSTGKPKGVQVPHLAAACSIESHSTAIPLPEVAADGFRWFQFAAPTFDPSLMEIFVTLSSGGTLCSAPRDLILQDLEGTVNESRASIMMATPSLAALLRPSRLTTLKHLWTMGEKLNRTVINNFACRDDSQDISRTNYNLVNAYGPTEGAINCTFLTPVTYSVRGSIIGEALPTCSMFVLDPNSHVPQPVPVGYAGELAIGGPQVSKGYLNREMETAKAFVESDEFGRLYRTGDMARFVWDASGRQLIEFLGRINSDQVKLSGRRVELGEIESVLSVVGGVKEVVAVVSQRDCSKAGSEQIHACLALMDGQDREKDEIIEACHRVADNYLSSYMRPSGYLVLDQLPRITSGKVDRKAIVAMLSRKTKDSDFQVSEAMSGTEAVQEWDPRDDALCDLVVSALARVVGEERSTIKPGTKLYSLGLDSLGAMRLLQNLRDLSVGGLGVVDVLRSETPQALISLVRDKGYPKMSAQAGKRDALEKLKSELSSFSQRNLLKCAERLQIEETEIEKVLPTTATQSGMLASFLRSSTALRSTKRSYIYHSVLPINAGVDISHFKEAWEVAIQSHDSFRTVFCWLDDDLAPFAQCILTPKETLDVKWTTYPADKRSSQSASVQAATSAAEGKINIEKSPWQFSIVESEKNITFILSMFHGIFDGGTLQLLLEDVFAAYHKAPRSPRTSLEHIVEHHFLADQEETSNYWNSQLESYIPVDFPSISPTRAPPLSTTYAVETPCRIGHDRLKQASKAMGVTALSVLQSAWASILLAYSGTRDQDIVMGSVISGRLDDKSEVCVGPTFTTVPIRLSLNKIPKFGKSWKNKHVAEHLTRLNLEALSHLQPRLGSVVTAEGRLPYDTLLAYQDFSAGSSAADIWESIGHPAMTNDFAVMIEVWPDHQSNLILRATFNDTIMNCKAAEIMLSQMSGIIEWFLSNSDGDFLTAPYTQDPLLKSGLDPMSAVSKSRPTSFLHAEFEKNAKSNPDDVALLFMNDVENKESDSNLSWTYHELDSRAQALAVHLTLQGPMTGAAIPICMEKSPGLYVAILAILKAGSAWCPIDTTSPPQRRSDLIARTGSSLVLISKKEPLHTDASIPAGVQSIDVDAFLSGSLTEYNYIKTHKLRSPKPHDIAYLIWTSGTTGAPKGVPISHAAGVASISSLLNAIPQNENAQVRCLQFSQYTFDVSIQDIFYTWSCGGTLISAPREKMLGSFAQLANITEATHAHLTPAFSAGIRRDSCKTLKVITMIGEKLPQPVADDWGKNMRAFNTYGPAEATIVSTVREFGNSHNKVKSANIGWPLDTLSVFVMRDQKIMMKQAVGELALGGPQLSPGYLKQEDITKDKYRWNDDAYQILYKTGDLVRMLADGSLEYINRVDDLVKLGGIRVELSEISYTLDDSHSLIENVETFVLSRSDRPVQVLVAFISAPKAADDGPNCHALLGETAVEIARASKSKALRSLPKHMIPSFYIVVPSIPKTQSAKTDRRALQAIYAELDIESWEVSLKLDDDSEAKLEDVVFDSVLKANLISIISAFAHISEDLVTESSRLNSLGIDSIRAIRLASRLNEDGHNLSVLEVLQCQTVRDLLRLVGPSEKAPKDKSVYDLTAFNDRWHDAVASEVQKDFIVAPATPIQEGLLSETMGTMEMYWSNHFFELDAETEISRLKRAWNTVCHKNTALRTGFIPVAVIKDKTPDVPEECDLIQVTYEELEMDWVYHTATKDDCHSFFQRRLQTVMKMRQDSYFRQPPWALTILDDGSKRTLILTIHHSIHDGTSLGYLESDVRSAYHSKPPSRPQLQDALPLITPTLKQRDENESFWELELEKFRELDIPAWPDLTGKRVRNGAVTERKFISETIRLSKSLESLQQKTAEFGLSSISSIIRAAWANVALSYLGSPAFVFAETLSDRVLDSQVDKTIGPFISVVPVPYLPGGTVREVLTEQHRIASQSLKHRHVHAREIRRMLRRPRGEALYPGVYTFHPTNESLSSQERPIWTEKKHNIGLSVEHPFAVNVYQSMGGSIDVEVSSMTTVMSAAHLSLFAQQIDLSVSAMLENPDEPINGLSRLFPSNLLSISTPRPTDAVQNAFMLSPSAWVERHTREHPDWIAVEVANSISEIGVEKQSLTYRELDTQADRVAAYLASKGFHNRSIAICSRRNIPSYPITLGIFKSGNAYVPIDEGLPDDRKAFLIEDGNCALVFTESAFEKTFSNIPDTCQVICFDGDSFQKELAATSTGGKNMPSHPDDNAYVLYTSGSTGKPKGVMVTRGNLCVFVESLYEFICEIAPASLELGGKGRWLAQASRAFDPHLAEMFLPWRFGMVTCTGDRTLLMDNIESTLAKWNITHASFVPSLLDQANILPNQFPHLKYLSVGGEKISQRVLDTWGAAPGVGITNAYGPTEVTIGCTFARVNEDTTLRNIGAPLSACTGHIFVGDTFQLALRGQVGELCFSGDLVAKGYLNRPDAKGFVIGPNGEKMYRTGDMGRMLTDETIEYLGRGDDQTKIRGQRLELGEVSEAIRSSSQLPIDVVSMIGKHHALARSQLISFVARSDKRKKGDKVSIIASDISTMARDLQDTCKSQLPSYMVPELVLPVTHIPLAPMSGKANTKELQGLFSTLSLDEILRGNAASGAGAKHTPSRPLTADEEKVAAEISNLVSIDRSLINHNTNIFEVGVDSLGAIGLSVRLRNVGYSASVAAIMSNPVIEQLALMPKGSNIESTHISKEALDEKLFHLESAFAKDYPEGINPSQVSIRPCLPLQEGLVARSMNSDGGDLYVNHISLKIRPTVKSGVLKAAWHRTVERNDILRTAFAPLALQMVQMIFPAAQSFMHWTEQEFADLDESVKSFQEQQTSISQAIIDNITITPPIRFLLAKAPSSGEPLALLISVHHSLYDGESFGMLLEDVAKSYSEDTLPKRGLPSTFIEHIFSQDLERSKSHWTQVLNGCQPTLFRQDHVIAEKSHFATHVPSLPLSKIESCASSLKTTLPSLMQSIFALALADAVDSADITFGVVLSGRSIAVDGADSVLLPCITTIPGRLNVQNLATVEEVIAQVQRSNAKSLEYQHTSLRHIQRWITSKTPLFDCLFSFVQKKRTSNENLWEEIDTEMPLEYPFAIEVEADYENDQLNINSGFTSSFGSPTRAQGIMEKMNLVLSKVLSGESMSLSAFNLSSSSPQNIHPIESDWTNDEWSSLELEIRRITAEFCTLDVNKVSKGASFLRLGIDSVTAIQFSRTLRAASIPVSSADIMRFSCVGALAEHVQQKTSTGQIALGAAQAKSPNLNRLSTQISLLDSQDSVETIFQCTPLQSSMITQTLGTEGGVYVHPHIVRLLDAVNEDSLKDALEKVIAANDILRTSFHFIPELNNPWIGAVHSRYPVIWHEATIPDDRDVVAAVTEALLLNNESAFASPPFRPVLIHRSGERFFSILMHHALYDGVSLPFIFDDLLLAYNGADTPKRPQFSDAASHLTQDQESACAFWTEKLAGYQVAELPPLDISESSTSLFLSELHVNVDIATILKACRGLEITVQTVSMLAFAKVLSRLLGREDVVFGQVLAGRSVSGAEAEHTIGPFFNTVAQRVTFGPKLLSNREMAQALQRHTAESQDHQHAPLRAVQNSLRRTGNFRSASLFDTLFVFQKSAQASGYLLEDQKIWTPFNSETTEGQAEYKLNIEVDHADDGIIARASSNGQYLSQVDLDTILRSFSDAFYDIIISPTRSVTEFPDYFEGRQKPNISDGPHGTIALDHSSPKNEPLIREILSEISGLPIDNIQPDTSIFTIGLDSLSAIRIAAQCRSHGLSAGVADVLQGNTLRGISSRVKTTRQETQVPKPPLIENYEQVEQAILAKLDFESSSIESILPCLAGQVYHLASWLKCGRTLFEPAWTYSSSQRIDPARLRESWVTLQERNPIMRTCFATVSPLDVVQVILKPGMVNENTFQIAEHSTTLAEAAQAQAKLEALHPSSMTVPPVRLRLLKATDRDGIVVLINHAAYDAWSMPMLVTELINNYLGETPESSAEFSSFVQFTQQNLSALNQTAYWNSIVGNSVPTLIKSPKPNNLLLSQKERQLFVGSWGKLKNLSLLEDSCRASGITLQSVILLAVSSILGALTGVASPTFGLYQAGRSAAFTDIERLAGPCLNVTPFTVHNSISNDNGIASNPLEAIRSIQSALVDRIPYEQSSLREILKEWSRRNDTTSPLFNTWVNLLWMQQTPASSSAETSGVLLEPLAIGVPTDFMPPTDLPGDDLLNSSVADLDTSFIPDTNIFIDIGPDAKTDSIGFGVRVEGGVMEEVEARAFIDGVAAEIERLVNSLS